MSTLLLISCLAFAYSVRAQDDADRMVSLVAGSLVRVSGVLLSLFVFLTLFVSQSGNQLYSVHEMANAHLLPC